MLIRFVYFHHLWILLDRLKAHYMIQGGRKKPQEFLHPSVIELTFRHWWRLLLICSLYCQIPHFLCCRLFWTLQQALCTHSDSKLILAAVPLLPSSAADTEQHRLSIKTQFNEESWRLFHQGPFHLIWWLCYVINSERNQNQMWATTKPTQVTTADGVIFIVLCSRVVTNCCFNWI